MIIMRSLARRPRLTQRAMSCWSRGTMGQKQPQAGTSQIPSRKKKRSVFKANTGIWFASNQACSPNFRDPQPEEAHWRRTRSAALCQNTTSDLSNRHQSRWPIRSHSVRDSPINRASPRSKKRNEVTTARSLTMCPLPAPHVLCLRTEMKHHVAMQRRAPVDSIQAHVTGFVP